MDPPLSSTGNHSVQPKPVNSAAHPTLPPPSFRRQLSGRYVPPRMKEYVLTEKLGSGTYATVYKGYKKGNTRDIVAVKCIKKSSLSKTSTENLLREIEILKSLDHENIVKLKDFQWDHDNVFLILEYCSGGDLSSYIQRYKRLPENVARKFLQQLALALKYIRERNISHMDLKPQNLLILSKENLVLKVGDFGFAQYILDQEGRNSLRGSPLYMAVEMFVSDSYDASVDLWSTGCILHETLFGYAPFASPTYEELERKILCSSKISLPSEPRISSKCKDLLIRLLQRDPKQRISFEDFFAHPFVDLEHAPCDEVLQKAIDTVTCAIKYDMDGKSKLAVAHYCSALEYFLPAIEYEKNPDKKVALRLKVRQYIDRAEQLKLLRKQKNLERKKDELTLEDCAKRLPGLQQALRHADVGEQYDNERKYVEALQQYERASDLCMSILSSIEKRGQTYELIKEKVEQLLQRMEELYRYKRLMSLEDGNQRVCCIQ